MNSFLGKCFPTENICFQAFKNVRQIANSPYLSLNSRSHPRKISDKSINENCINDPLTSAFGRTGRYNIDEDLDKNPFKLHIRILLVSDLSEILILSSSNKLTSKM